MFEKVLGQKKSLKALEADFEENRLAESYLFAGPEGVGKKFAALELAKALSCARSRRASLIPEAETAPVPCGECPACRKIDAQTHPDVFVLDFISQAALLNLKEEEAAKQKEFKIEA